MFGRYMLESLPHVCYAVVAGWMGRKAKEAPVENFERGK